MFKSLYGLFILVFSVTFITSGCTRTAPKSKGLYKLSIKNLEGETVDFSGYKGKTLLIVNTASKCGYTGQLGGLEKLHQKYTHKGLVILGFPSNDFKQEDLSGGELKKFCQRNYGVTFPVFRKSHVNGPKRNPVYSYLVQKSLPPGKDIQWNFEKFVVDGNGNVIGRFSSKIKPGDEPLIEAIEKGLKRSSTTSVTL